MSRTEEAAGNDCLNQYPRAGRTGVEQVRVAGLFKVIGGLSPV